MCKYETLPVNIFASRFPVKRQNDANPDRMHLRKKNFSGMKTAPVCHPEQSGI